MDVFEKETARYDRWFDSTQGRSIFVHETACIRELIGGAEGRWIEVGVGTGRFAEVLGIREGIDPSPAMLSYAVRRGIQVVIGRGENLPYVNGAFDGVLLVVTICFVMDPAGVFRECRRILKENGCLIVGFVPAESAWGKFYAEKGRKGHVFYSSAKFYTYSEIKHMAEATGFSLAGARSCLFLEPGSELPPDPVVRKGVTEGAGFAAVKFRAVAGGF